MLKIAMLSALIALPSTALAGQRYCEETPDPNYGSFIEEIPYGIAYVTEEVPIYCQLGYLRKNGVYKCIESAAPDEFEVNIQIFDTDTPRIIVADKVYVPCPNE